MAQLIFTILITFVLGLTEICYADLYMYADENGSIFFTDAPTHSGYVKIKETPKPSQEPALNPLNQAQGQGRSQETGVKGQNTEPRSQNQLAKSSNLDKGMLYKNIQHTAKKHDVDPDLVWAVIKAESNFNSEAVSRKGAIGLMQLMPATARAFDISNPFNPHQNIEGGAKYLRYLLSLFNGDLSLSLAAYNAGETTVLNYKNIPPFSETRDYVNRVLSFYRELKYYNRIQGVKVPRSQGILLKTSNP